MKKTKQVVYIAFGTLMLMMWLIAKGIEYGFFGFKISISLFFILVLLVLLVFRYLLSSYQGTLLAWCKTYKTVFPATFSFPKSAQKESPSLLPPSQVVLDILIGKGSFTIDDTKQAIEDFKDEERKAGRKPISSYQVTQNTSDDKAARDILIRIVMLFTDLSHAEYQLSDGTDPRQSNPRPKGWSIKPKVNPS